VTKDSFEVTLTYADGVGQYQMIVTRAEWGKILDGAIEAGFLRDARTNEPPRESRESKRDEALHVATLLVAGREYANVDGAAGVLTYKDAIDDAVALIAAVDERFAKESG
jgi:hypothetical protein